VHLPNSNELALQERHSFLMQLEPAKASCVFHWIEIPKEPISKVGVRNDGRHRCQALGFALRSACSGQRNRARSVVSHSQQKV
jgi:hypothetical protein